MLFSSQPIFARVALLAVAAHLGLALDCPHDELEYGCSSVSLLQSNVGMLDVKLDLESDSQNKGPPPTVHVVAAFCEHVEGLKANLARAQEALQMSDSQVTVISKCGKENDLTNMPGVRVIELPNVGREAHSYAWALANLSSLLPSRLPEDGVVVFLKDNSNNRKFGSLGSVAEVKAEAKTHGTSFLGLRPFAEVTAEAQTHGFGCFSFGEWPLVSSLRKFSLSNYTDTNGNPSLQNFAAPEDQRPLGEWWDKLELPVNISNYTDVKAKWWVKPLRLEKGAENAVVPVCYGGQFAVRMSNIQAVPSSVWHRLINSLQRGESIEEVHYAERTWAALFSAGTVTSYAGLVRAQIPGAWARRVADMSR